MLISYIILLLILASIAKASYDAHEHSYISTPFYRWSLKETAWGKFWKYFSGPDSWRNKNKYKNQILRYLFRGPLVWLTDLPHFAEFVRKSAMETSIILPLAYIYGWDLTLPVYLFLLAIAKTITGSVFEFFYSVLRSDYTLPLAQPALDSNDYQIERVTRDSEWAVRKIQISIVLSFVIAIGSHLLMVWLVGAPAPVDAGIMHPSVIVPVLVVCISWMVLWKIISQDQNR